MKKLLFLILIALTCGCLTLSACKKKEEPAPLTEEAAPPAPETAPAPESSPAPVPEAVPAPSQETPQSAK